MFFKKIVDYLMNPTTIKLSLNSIFSSSWNGISSVWKKKIFTNRASKYRVLLWFYITITLEMCPYLRNHLNEFFDVEGYGLYYILISAFIFNLIINYFMSIPRKNVLNFKQLLLKFNKPLFLIKSLFFKISKFSLFFYNEVIKKSFLFNYFSLFFKKLKNYFILWRPLFKRFSYFGFNKLTKSKFFKKNQNQ